MHCIVHLNNTKLFFNNEINLNMKSTIHMNKILQQRCCRGGVLGVTIPYRKKLVHFKFFKLLIKIQNPKRNSWLRHCCLDLFAVKIMSCIHGSAISPHFVFYFYFFGYQKYIYRSVSFTNLLSLTIFLSILRALYRNHHQVQTCGI